MGRPGLEPDTLYRPLSRRRWHVADLGIGADLYERVIRRLQLAQHEQEMGQRQRHASLRRAVHPGVQEDPSAGRVRACRDQSVTMVVVAF